MWKEVIQRVNGTVTIKTYQSKRELSEQKKSAGRKKEESEDEKVDREESENESYEIERIIDHKKDGKDKYSYLVRWKGYDSSNDSWVKQEDFNSTKIIKDYWKSEQ